MRSRKLLSNFSTNHFPISFFSFFFSIFLPFFFFLFFLNHVRPEGSNQSSAKLSEKRKVRKRRDSNLKVKGGRKKGKREVERGRRKQRRGREGERREEKRQKRG